MKVDDDEKSAVGVNTPPIVYPPRAACEDAADARADALYDSAGQGPRKERGADEADQSEGG